MVILLKKLLFIFSIFSILSLLACKKDTSVPLLQNTITDVLSASTLTAKINQGIFFHDTIIAANDSLSILTFPPYSRYYKWIVTPNGCDSILHDSATSTGIIFHCPGTYTVYAIIYSSLTNKIIGNTSTTTINVSNDTLQLYQPITPDDTLVISPTIDTTTLNNSVLLQISTSKAYLAYPLTYFDPSIVATPSTGENNYNYAITYGNNIWLSTYPYVSGAVENTRLTENMYLGPSPISSSLISKPVTLNLTINWLGKTYAGSITVTAGNKFLVNWNYTDGVVIKQ